MITNPIRFDLMKSTITSVLAFPRSLLRLEMWADKFFRKAAELSLLMGTIICFLDGPFIVIWMHGLGLEFSFTMLLTLSIWLAFKAGKDSLIFSISDILGDCLDAWAYDLVGLSMLDLLLVSLKYFEILSTSFLVLAGRGGRRGAFLIEMEIGVGVFPLMLFLMDVDFRVNLAEIFNLRVLVLLSVWRKSHLAL